MTPILLASASPRRHELLAFGGIAFQVRPADLPEIPEPGEAPSRFVERMSQAKARQVAASERERCVVIGADTVVVLPEAGELDTTDGPSDPGEPSILGKPRDAAHAVELLRRLRGRTHIVYTGITVLDGAAQRSEVVRARVPMRDYSDEEIEAYVASGDPLDKAGAYAIQYPGFQPVDLARFEDCFANVMGLPVCRVLRLVGEVRPDLMPRERPLGDCRHFGARECPVVPAIRAADKTSDQ
jgi:MAF protein